MGSQEKRGEEGRASLIEGAGGGRLLGTNIRQHLKKSHTWEMWKRWRSPKYRQNCNTFNRFSVIFIDLLILLYCPVWMVEERELLCFRFNPLKRNIQRPKAELSFCILLGETLNKLFFFFFQRPKNPLWFASFVAIHYLDPKHFTDLELTCSKNVFQINKIEQPEKQVLS